MNSEEAKNLIKSIDAQWKVTKGNWAILKTPSPNMNSEQKENILKTTKGMIENMIEDFEQLKITINYDRNDQPINSFGEEVKKKALEDAPFLSNYLPKA